MNPKRELHLPMVEFLVEKGRAEGEKSLQDMLNPNGDKSDAKSYILVEQFVSKAFKNKPLWEWITSKNGLIDRQRFDENFEKAAELILTEFPTAEINSFSHLANFEDDELETGGCYLQVYLNLCLHVWRTKYETNPNPKIIEELFKIDLNQRDEIYRLIQKGYETGYVKVQPSENDKILHAIAHLLYGVCYKAPFVEVIEPIFHYEIVKQQDDLKLNRAIHSYQRWNDNTTCTIVLFDAIAQLRHQCGDVYEKKAIYKEARTKIEQVIKFFITKANEGKMTDCELNGYLELAAGQGQTLFSRCATHSEALTRLLLKRGVKCTAIESNFAVPEFNKNFGQELLEKGYWPYIEGEHGSVVDHHSSEYNFDTFNRANRIDPDEEDIYFTTHDSALIKNELIPFHYDTVLPIDLFEKDTKAKGRGGEGFVLAAFYRDSRKTDQLGRRKLKHGKRLAWKFVPVRKTAHATVADGIKHERCVTNERQKLQQLKDCSNIVQFYGHFKCQLSKKSVDQVNFLLRHADLKETKHKKFDVYMIELCDGNLKQLKEDTFLNSENQNYSDNVKTVIRGIFDALIQLEENSCSHNDIKLTNFFYKFEKGKLKVLLGDFGIANKSGGTPGYASPELNKRNFTKSSDLYSAGITLLELLCEDKIYFYRLRDNWLTLSADILRKNWKNLSTVLRQSWQAGDVRSTLAEIMKNFHEIPELKMIRKMVCLDEQKRKNLSLITIRDDWCKRSTIQKLSESQFEAFILQNKHIRENEDETDRDFRAVLKSKRKRKHLENPKSFLNG